MSYRIEAIFELVDKVSGNLDRIEDRFKNIGGTMQKAGGIMSAGVTVPAVMLGKQSLDLAMDVERLTNTLEGMAGGAEGAAGYIEAIQSASGGTISEVDALAIANRALSFGVVKTTDDMEKLVTTSIGLGRAQGLDSVQAVSDFTTALSRNSPMILDNLGLTLKMSEAYTTYADMLGKPVESLTDLEKSEAFRSVALMKGVGLVEEMGGVQGDSASSMEQLNAMFTDAKTLIGEQLIPILADFLELLKPIFDWIGNLTDEQAGWITKIGLVVAAIGPLLVILGTILPAIGTVIGVIAGISAPVLLIVGAIIALGIAWSTNFLGIRDTVMGFWEKAQPILQEVVAFLEGVFAAVVAEVVPFVQGLFQQLVDWYTENFPLIQATVQTVMEFIWRIISWVLTQIDTFWTAHGEKIMNYIGLMWENIKLIVETAINIVLGIIKTVMLLITGDFEGAWVHIQEIALEVWENLKQYVENGLNAILGFFGTTLPEVVTTVEEWIAGLQEKIGAFVEGMRTKVDEAVAWVKDIPKKIMEGIKLLWERLKTIGGRIVSSLAEGISAAISGLVSTLVGGVQSAVTAMAEALGFGSPSKIMMDFGRNLMIGMSLGVAGAADLVTDEIANVASRTVWTAGAYSLLPVGAGAGNVTNYNLTYNAYPYGLPSQANADEAMQEIESQSYGRR